MSLPQRGCMDFIGKYSIIELLQDNFDSGRKTYLVESNGEKFVIKQFQFALKDSTWSSYKSLEKEIKALQSLDYYTIPNYIESFDTDQGTCLVMQHIPGDNLSGKQLNVAEVKEVVNSILDILVYLQSQSPSVVHRDIKPQNIIKSTARQGFWTIAKNNYYLIDFGLAIQTNLTMSFSSNISGTLGFMPPEIFRGIKLDKSADLYSLAVTAFCLLTGKSATELSKLLDSNLVLSVSSLKPKVSGEFLDWLERCLNPNPLKRFSSAKQAQHKFNQIDVRKPKPKSNCSSAWGIPQNRFTIEPEKETIFDIIWPGYQQKNQISEYSYLQMLKKDVFVLPKKTKKTKSLSLPFLNPVFLIILGTASIYGVLIIFLFGIFRIEYFEEKYQLNQAREICNKSTTLVDEYSPNCRNVINLRDRSVAPGS